MAFFSKKPPSSPNSTPPSDGEKSGFEPDPAKAAKFFEHAKTTHETTNYEYAMQLWLRGLKFQPTNMDAIKGFFESSAAFLNTGAKKAGKETYDAASGRADVEKLTAAMLQWAMNPTDGSSAVAATLAAGQMGLIEPVKWLGERAIAAVMRDKRPTKRNYVQLFEILGKFGVYDKAVLAGEAAVRLDPTDSKLAADVRNMSAQQTMTRGGFDETGKEGGFRQNIRDSGRQAKLEEEERMVKTEETLDRLVASAKADYESRPTDRPAIKKYIARLRERGTPEDIKAAYALAMESFKLTQDFSLRQEAGDIKMRIAKANLAKMQREADKDAASKEKYEKARAEYNALEIEEFQLRVKAYPTNLEYKFELGKRLFDGGRFEEAIGLLQEAKNDGKNRLRVLDLLGQSFTRISWNDEAVETFRQAIDAAQGADSETLMNLRYGLMTSLQARATEGNDLPAAEEAYKLASAIAIEQIGYRDVRARREEIKQLVARLKAGA